MDRRSSDTTEAWGCSEPDAGYALPTFLEFFAGSGLVAEGMRGIFRGVWANDICPKKASVYGANHAAGHFKLGSVTEVSGADLPSAQLSWASFPCQDLSLAGMSAGIHGERSGLVWHWLRVMDEMQSRPSVLVAENVTGLVSAKAGTHYRELHHALTERGYRVGAVMLDAVHWTPQSRPRIFVVAFDTNRRVPAHLTDAGPNWAHSDALIRAARGLDEHVWWRLPEPHGSVPRLSDVVECDAPFPDWATQAHNLALISPRHRKVIEAMPKHMPVTAAGYRRTRNGQQVLELRFDNLAGCLRTPSGGSSRQVLVLRREGQLRTRLMTARETARLMGAPDSYRLPASYNDAYKAMGDAVAVPVARHLAQHLLAPLVNAPHG